MLEYQYLTKVVHVLNFKEALQFWVLVMKNLTHKAPPIICSRPQFQFCNFLKIKKIGMTFHENRLLQVWTLIMKNLTKKAPPIICSRRQFQILQLFKNKNKV